MKTKVVALDHLVDFLSEVSNKNLTELSKLTGISLVTFHNWKNGSVTKLNYKTRSKLGKALEKYKWGFRISEYQNHQVEIIFDDNYSLTEFDSLKQENTELKEVVYKQSKEIIKLQEELQKYGVKK